MLAKEFSQALWEKLLWFSIRSLIFKIPLCQQKRWFSMLPKNFNMGWQFQRTLKWSISLILKHIFTVHTNCFDAHFNHSCGCSLTNALLSNKPNLEIRWIQWLFWKIDPYFKISYPLLNVERGDYGRGPLFYIKYIEVKGSVLTNKGKWVSF